MPISVGLYVALLESLFPENGLRLPEDLDMSSIAISLLVSQGLMNCSRPLEKPDTLSSALSLLVSLLAMNEEYNKSCFDNKWPDLGDKEYVLEE